MNDLISRQEAIRLAEQGQIQGFEWQFKKLCTLPSAEPEIIRCKDCKYWQDNNDGYFNDECRWWNEETPEPDDFCSYAERRGEQE